MLNSIVLIIGILAIAYGGLAAGLTIRAILKERGERYRIRYKEFLEQQKRVETQTKGEDKHAR